MDKEEIEVGEYVRTKDGKIDQILNYSIGCNVWHCKNGMCIDECNCLGVHLKDIVKHSKNIIDLIEEGDIIDWKFKDSSFVDRNAIVQSNNLGVYVQESDYIAELEDIVILRILAHEQFERNCYILKEE